ncbi:hypothetical protein [Streptococcus sanguinis]|jgi:hypothetical protein|uniref:hypothetical protein n=1 Tax=Streptococcus sanguinis TaxID=1305 RepID=UPI000F68DA94|nr:hypothetical protein [Streptococcus sanguinis]RSI04697.1 hypothetical protein D8892_01290 [Streptococcus sanguinis]
MKRKTIIFSGLVLLALAFGALFLFASLNEASLDGVYYRQIEDEADGFSGLDKETILNLRGQQVTLYKDGLKEKGSIDRKAGSIRLGSKFYSYVHNGDLLMLKLKEDPVNSKESLYLVRKDSLSAKRLEQKSKSQSP